MSIGRLYETEDVAVRIAYIKLAAVGHVTERHGKRDARGSKAGRERLRVRDGMVRRAKSGFWLSGSVFGYTRVPIHDASGNRVRTELKINQEEAPIVRKIFALRAAGIG